MWDSVLFWQRLTLNAVWSLKMIDLLHRVVQRECCTDVAGDCCRRLLQRLLGS